MAGQVVLRVAGKGRRIDEPPFFLLRKIIRIYGELAAAPAKQQARLIRELFVVVFGRWRGRWLFWTTPSRDKAAFLVALPSQLGLETATGTASNPSGWGDVYAHLAATFGWEYGYIDHHLTLSALKELAAYLRNHPPTHLLVAAYLDYEPPLTLAEKRKRFFARFTGK
ncbi:MAG: hypothetical protein PHU14_00050 [Methylovulum sp.]|nr:hypothetical protein [Methylovulum sp.]